VVGQPVATPDSEVLDVLVMPVTLPSASLHDLVFVINNVRNDLLLESPVCEMFLLTEDPRSDERHVHFVLLERFHLLNDWFWTAHARGQLSLKIQDDEGLFGK
jgi:hypothetical protein